MSNVDFGRAAAAFFGSPTHAELAGRASRGCPRPVTDADAYAIQDLVGRSLGPVGGWKVGSATPESEPFRGLIQADTIFSETSRVPAEILHVIGVEAEIAYRFDRDLPPRATRYTRDEVLAAVGSIHPVIEILDTRFVALGTADPLGHRADHQNSGALAVGLALRDWRGVNPLQQPVRLTLNGALRHEGVGGNSAGDNIRLLVWLANTGAPCFGGIKAGQIVTTGSCSGTDFVDPGTRVQADFPGIGSFEIDIA